MTGQNLHEQLHLETISDVTISEKQNQAYRLRTVLIIQSFNLTLRYSRGSIARWVLSGMLMLAIISLIRELT